MQQGDVIPMTGMGCCELLDLVSVEGEDGFRLLAAPFGVLLGLRCSLPPIGDRTVISFPIISLFLLYSQADCPVASAQAWETTSRPISMFKRVMK